jgi:conjugal transfer pilus assembly protein TraF
MWSIAMPSSLYIFKLALVASLSLAVSGAETSFAAPQQAPRPQAVSPSSKQPEKFEGKRDGFFFYKDEKEAEKKAKEPPKAVTPVPPKKKKGYVKGSYNGKLRWADLEDMRTSEVSDLVNDVKDYAIQKPTPENVKTYMTLQAVVMEKASRFQKVWGEVLLENPVLNENAKRPASGYVSGMMIRQERDDMEAAVKEMREDMGILLFYTDDCPYCDAQKTILENFAKKHSWQNISGVNISQEPQAARDYNVQLVPDLWVVGNVNGRIERRRISAGVSAGSEIEKGLLSAHSRWFHKRPYEKKAYVPVTEFDEFLRSQDQDQVNVEEVDEETAENAGTETAEN